MWKFRSRRSSYFISVKLQCEDLYGMHVPHNSGYTRKQVIIKHDGCSSFHFLNFGTLAGTSHLPLICPLLWVYNLALCLLPAARPHGARRAKDPQARIPEGRQGVETIKLYQGINACRRKTPKLPIYCSLWKPSATACVSLGYILSEDVKELLLTQGYFTEPNLVQPLCWKSWQLGKTFY